MFGVAAGRGEWASAGTLCGRRDQGYLGRWWELRVAARGGKALTSNLCSRVQGSGVVMGEGGQDLNVIVFGVGPGKAAGSGVAEGEAQQDNPYS